MTKILERSLGGGLALALLACSGPTNLIAGAIPADAATEGPADEEDGGSGTDPCNALPTPTTLVPPQLSTDPRPAGETETGGSIADGTYALTSYSLYNVDPMDLATYQQTAYGETVRIAGNLLETAEVTEMGRDRQEEQTAFTMTITGSALTLAPRCPMDQGAEAAQFTTDGHQLRLSLERGDKVLVFDRR